MFVVVYASGAFALALFDEELGIDFARLVHGSQEFRWEHPVLAGDEIATTMTVQDISERGGMRFDRFASVSVNQRGQTTCTGTWMTIIRGED
jgi:acyl dehydratase